MTSRRIASFVAALCAALLGACGHGHHHGADLVMSVDPASFYADVQTSLTVHGNQFKPVGGNEDQAGGMVWRFQDGDNYYVVRANALEDNVVLYKTEKGKRSPLLVPKVEAIVHHYLRGRCINTPEVFIHEIGGTETHVHLAVSVAPTIGISEWIGQLKGSSSHEVNQKLSHKVLDWQAGYGVVSFGTAHLQWVKAYIRQQ